MLRQERAHTHCSRPRPRRTQQRAAATRRELRRWLRLRLRLRPCTAVRAPRRASSRAERGRSQCTCRISSRPRLLSLSAHVPRASSSFPLPIALAHTHPHSPNLFLNLSQLPQGVRRRGERGRRQVGVDPRQIKVEGDAEARAGTRAAAWLASDAAPPREEARACAEAERNEAAHEARRLGRGLPRSRDEDVVALVSRGEQPDRPRAGIAFLVHRIVKCSELRAICIVRPILRRLVDFATNLEAADDAARRIVVARR